MKKFFMGTLLLITSIVGCTTKTKSESEELPNIIIDKKTDWGANFKLHIQSKTTKNTSYVYKVCSFNKDIPVGFELEVPIKLDKFGEGVTFKSLGDTSDNFLKFLFSLYELNLQDNLKFTNNTNCNYTCLNDIPFKGDGQKRLKSVNYIKVFFEGTQEKEYAELYVNIDEGNNVIEFEEKDFEYRPYIAFFLMAK